MDQHKGLDLLGGEDKDIYLLELSAFNLKHRISWAELLSFKP